MYVRLRACVSVCLCVSMYLRIYVSIHLSMCVCMYVCTYLCTYVRLYVCMYICMFAHLYAYMAVCLYVCMHACICVCLCMCFCMCLWQFVYVCVDVLPWLLLSCPCSLVLDCCCNCSYWCSMSQCCMALSFLYLCSFTWALYSSVWNLEVFLFIYLLIYIYISSIESVYLFDIFAHILWEPLWRQVSAPGAMSSLNFLGFVTRLELWAQDAQDAPDARDARKSHHAVPKVQPS